MGRWWWGGGTTSISVVLTCHVFVTNLPSFPKGWLVERKGKETIFISGYIVIPVILMLASYSQDTKLEW